MTHPVDAHVGKRIQYRRRMIKLTQQQLAAEVGVKPQQIQKYESGFNSVSASRLWEIADVLQVPISFFYEGIDASGRDKPAPVPGDILADKEAMVLVRAYYAIPEQQRRRLFDLARVLADDSE